MEIRREWLEDLIFHGEANRRYTQDSPVLPDVWLEFAEILSCDPYYRVDLLLTPHRDSSAPALANEVRARLKQERETDAWWEWHCGADDHSPRIAYHQTGVAGQFTFPELLRVVLPLSKWWREVIPGTHDDLPTYLQSPAVRAEVLEELERLAVPLDSLRRAFTKKALAKPTARRAKAPLLSTELVWMIRIVGTILVATVDEPDQSESTLVLDDQADDVVVTAGRNVRPRTRPRDPAKERFLALSREHERLLDAFLSLSHGMLPPKSGARPSLYTVTRNRRVSVSISRSVLAVKGDAARRLFEIDTRNIAWAVLDSGIDARHPAFRKRLPTGEPRQEPFAIAPGRSRWENQTTVAATFDFSRIRSLLDPETGEHEREMSAPAVLSGRGSHRRPPAVTMEQTTAQPITSDVIVRRAQELTVRIREGRAIDWDELAPLLVVPHNDTDYESPAYDHGTHVAGILAGDWRKSDDAAAWPATDATELMGVCPGLTLYDMRVLDENGEGDEFTVMAALQFVRHLNAHRDQQAVHGVNLSLSLKHDVANYACGRTPVCDECGRVVSSGVVVVAAAGNDGYLRFTTPVGESEGYRSISISDPGNAESVITVGATHRHAPHTYGVSYFSSRGPTGDGRSKPDLVAPGEKITAPVPGGAIDTKDGTSMAAPHVSGAAVILMARHRELLGQPARVKEILCSTATDLGRERYFQGAGMVDILRALQSV